MKAVEANFLRFLKKSDQLEVPIYQRTHSWTRPECLQLWSDIVRASQKDVSGHFIGSIVYIDTGIRPKSAIDAIEIIDGQQRLTTISLLLLALARSAESEDDDSGLTPKKLIKDYLLQDDDEDEGEEARYKLLLTKGDREALMRLLDGNELNGKRPDWSTTTASLRSRSARRRSLWSRSLPGSRSS